MSAVIYDFETGKRIDEGGPSLEEQLKEFLAKDPETAVQNMIALNQTVNALKSYLASIAQEMEKNPSMPTEEYVKSIRMFLSA